MLHQRSPTRAASPCTWTETCKYWLWSLGTYFLLVAMGIMEWQRARRGEELLEHFFGFSRRIYGKWSGVLLCVPS